MAADKTSVLEVMRGAVLANHSAAGLLAGLRRSKSSLYTAEALGECTRMLRTCEAISRQVVGIMTNAASKKVDNNTGGGGKNVGPAKVEKKDGDGGGGSGGGGLGGFAARNQKSSKQRRKSKKRKAANGDAMQFDETRTPASDEVQDLPDADAPPGAQQAFSPQNFENLKSSLDAMFGSGASGSNSAAAAASGGGGGIPRFPYGTMVVIHGLSAQPALNHTVASVCPNHLQKADGRVTVNSVATKKNVRIKAENLKISMPHQDPYHGMFEGEFPGFESKK